MDAQAQAQTQAQTQAQAILARRTLARRRFLPFILNFEPQYLAGWVHKDICTRLEQFEADVKAGLSPRLMLTMPPRHGKSMIASQYFPAWYLGRNPDDEIIATSYSSSLAGRFSRSVRSIFRDPDFNAVFPGAVLDPDAQSIETWMTLKGGSYTSAGVGGGITGKGAHVLIIDDPIKSAEDAESETYREMLWDWYASTAYTRLAPGGGILIIQCMTGDTPVLRPDGTETPLRDIRPGDQVATYDAGRLTSARVLNHTSNGHDNCFRITTTSGKMVRANERHPFLVETPEGELQWIRLKNLNTTHKIVTLKDSGGNGKGKPVSQMTVTSQRSAGPCAASTTSGKNGQTGTVLHRLIQRIFGRGISSIGMASRWTSTMRCWKHKAASVLSAVIPQPIRTPALTGTGNFASITAMTASGCADYSATTVTSPSVTPKQQKTLSELLPTSDFTTDQIVSIEPAGRHEVFDLQVEGTENFIANNLVSHNTRWHHDDLSGRLLEKGEAGEGDPFELVNYPAEAMEDESYRKRGDPLHAERYPIEALRMIKRAVGPRVWSALYQQQPTEDTGSYFKAEWMRYYDKPPPLDELTVYAAWDLAIGQREHNDYSVGTVIGVDNKDDVWVLDQVAGRWDANEIVERMLDLCELWRPAQTLVEKGHIDMAIGPWLDKRRMERGLNWVAFKSLPTGRRDKQARARGIQGMFQTSRVKLPKYGGWVDAFVQELLTFPFGKHDDRVDSIAWIGLYLTEMVPGKVKAKAKPASWRDKLTQYVKRSDVDSDRSWLAS